MHAEQESALFNNHAIFQCPLILLQGIAAVKCLAVMGPINFYIA